MLPPVHIPVQPSSQDCLAWSPDGELAVAAGEEIYLLIPQDGGCEPWTHLRITISSFTFGEWPWQESASFKDMSIGEEQARATVTALAWSPAGLAKHRRSVLAVLTSNLILSFWASNADPSDADSWERILVVNKALLPGSRLQQRIRSMAWAPTNPQHVDHQTPFSWRKWGIPLIAVADDNNGLYIFKVSSPFTGRSSEWGVKLVLRHSVPVSSSSTPRPSLFRLVMNASHYVDRIQFGTWDVSIPLTYRTSGIVHQASLSVHEDLPSRVRPGDLIDSKSFTVDLDELHGRNTNMLSPSAVKPSVKAQMVAEKEKFGLDNKISSQVTLRRWGLASFNNLAAACITLHPAKMIEYIAPFDGISTILFDAGDKNGDANNVFPWQSLEQADVAKAQRAILDTILDQKLLKSLALNDFDVKIIYTAFCGNLLLSADDRLQPLQRLEAAVEGLNVIEHHASIDLDAEHRALLSLKDAPQLTEQQLVNAIAQMTKAKGQAESSSRKPKKALLDLCPFCPEGQSIIPFNSLIEAYCPQGHLFARCALTFLPLLEPGSIKYCICCKREFIDERSHPRIQIKLSPRLSPTDVDDGINEKTDAVPESAGLDKYSLASLLFDKFDTCPYCGGKFCN